MEGFTLNIGKKELFYKSNGRNITNTVLEKFIDKIGETKHLSSDLVEKCKSDQATLKDLRRRVCRAKLELKNSGKVEYYKLSGKGFEMSIPIDEAECLVIF